MSKTQKKREKRRKKRERRRLDKAAEKAVRQYSAPDPAPTEETYFPFQGDIHNILQSLGFPSADEPEQENGVVCFAEAKNHCLHPYIAIRAFLGCTKKESDIRKEYEKAKRRGFAVWRPTLMPRGWDISIKKKTDSGQFLKLPTTEDPQEAKMLLCKEVRTA
ncbi:MAG: hypothetical protein COU47_04155 [Candidatus Niyogibacteria bacterium CG10_big_fil_rev_8_21_14_0_10_46_36]|uniref:Uncharacterized protein n=1 Tax=Candidatus Niyogibacteria bacterium CG10_big_fil_rev_8_21_14_0_10_46_36 TaxID=1974726 RepID=A0A2H0TCH2_9BACT|nr:MAG: hypothetical protein COU47_04155 [Candidatus Niyogibacteria bacterium CG10_big_fil_rev_8_21_14_0_10_46_36]